MFAENKRFVRKVLASRAAEPTTTARLNISVETKSAPVRFVSLVKNKNATRDQRTPKAKEPVQLAKSYACRMAPSGVLVTVNNCLSRKFVTTVTTIVTEKPTKTSNAIVSQVN